MNLETKLNQKKNRIGLVSGRLKINEYDDAEQNVTAHIEPRTWDIEINLKTGFNPVEDEQQKEYAEKKKIEDSKETLCNSLLTHELAHWELPFSSGMGCPFDAYNHDLITEAVKNALPKDKKSLAGYVTNAFEDMVINPRAQQFDKDFSAGQALFWDNQGIQARKQGQECYTPFYEAFVKLNLYLFGDEHDQKFLKRHFSESKKTGILKKFLSKDKKINQAVKKTIKELDLSRNQEDLSPLFQKERWPEMAKIFARNLVDLLDIKPTEKLSAFSGENEESGEKQKSGNGLEEKAGTREGKEEIAYGRYKSNNGQSPNIQSYEQLDLLYRTLAKSIPVNVEAMTRKHSLEIAPLNYRAFDEDKDDPRKIKPTKLHLTGEGEITFSYPNQPITVEEKFKFQRRSFPDFKRVIIDNSGTMKSAPDGSDNIGSTVFIPWGDNSRYHYALLGDEGIQRFLQDQGIAQCITHGLALFSSTTRYAEATFTELDKLRKLRYAPEWGSTNLGLDVLEQALQKKGSFVLSISDGDIDNWNDNTKNRTKKLMEENYCAHIQIGRKTEFSKDLESWDIPVSYVTSGEDLSKLMVNIATDTYKRFTTK